MAPTLRDGDRIWALLWPFKWLRPGMVVLATHPRHGLLIKRLARVDHAQLRFQLSSDNTEPVVHGCDEWLPRSTLLARVVAAPRSLKAPEAPGEPIRIE